MNGSIGAVLSLFPSAAGAILVFALKVPASGLNANVLGWILMQIGVAGLWVSVMIGSADHMSGG